MTREYDRRTFLRNAGAYAAAGLAVPSAVAGCGGDSGGSSVKPSGNAGAPLKTGGDLVWVSWEGYDNPKALKPWLSKSHIALKPTYVNSNDLITAKIVAAKRTGSAVDVATYYNAYFKQLQQLGLVPEIDVERIPNYKNLSELFRTNPFWAPGGKVTGVPFVFNWNGLVYDSAVIKQAPTSYDILFEPKYKGKVLVTEDTLSLYQQTTKIVGVDVTKMTDADFAKVEDWISRLLAQTRGVTPSYGDISTKLAAGDGVMAMPGYPAITKFAADAGKKTIRATIPQEGGYTSCDAWYVPPTVKHVDNAYAYINETLEPAISRQAAISLVAGTPVTAAQRNLPKDVAAGYTYDDLQQLFDKAPLFNNPPVESDQYKTIKDVLASWQKLKSNA